MPPFYNNASLQLAPNSTLIFCRFSLHMPAFCTCASSLLHAYFTCHCCTDARTW